MRATTSPGVTVIDTPSSTVSGPWRFTRLVMVIISAPESSHRGWVMAGPIFRIWSAATRRRTPYPKSASDVNQFRFSFEPPRQQRHRVAHRHVQHRGDGRDFE